MNKDVFDNLFVLEMTNNHQGRLDRALRIIYEHSRIVRANNVRAAIKLQFRDVDRFIHKDFRERGDIKYINRVIGTRMAKADYAVVVEQIIKSGCLPMATPFDEASVDWCVEFGLPIIKIASASSTEWILLEKIALTKKPCIVSFGGTPIKDMDDVVTFFEHRNIPLAINHCVAAYPHEDEESELDQIDYLRDRYPGHVIGWSSHEHTDWDSSIKIAYAKGARTFERHIDIEGEGFRMADYSSRPWQIDQWFKAFHRAVKFCGTARHVRKTPLSKETAYLDTYIRGVYARHELQPGTRLGYDDIYLAIPIQKGQLSCRELMCGPTGHILTKPVDKDAPIGVDSIDSPSWQNETSRMEIAQRGL